MCRILCVNYILFEVWNTLESKVLKWWDMIHWKQIWGEKQFMLKIQCLHLRIYEGFTLDYS